MSVSASKVGQKGFIGPLFLILIAINVAVFVVVAISAGTSSPSADILVEWGADFAPLTLTGESWRLVTSTFLHGNWIHLLTNMYMLFVVGGVLERVAGTLRFGVIYLLSGAAGGLLSALWQGHHQVTQLTGIVFGRGVYETGIAPAVGVGASGALMGLAAALLVFAVRESRDGNDRLRDVPIVRVILITLALGFLIPGLDNAAHIGGLLAGAFVACLLRDRHGPFSSRHAWWMPVVVATLGMGFIVLIASLGQSVELETIKEQLQASGASREMEDR